MTVRDPPRSDLASLLALCLFLALFVALRWPLP